MKLTFENFFTKFFVIHPENKELNRKDRTTALCCSIVLGVFTFGVLHSTCAIIEWCIRRSDKNVCNSTNKADFAGKKIFKRKKCNQINIRASGKIEQKLVSQETAQNLGESTGIKKTASFLWKKQIYFQKSSEKNAANNLTPPPLWSLNLNNQSSNDECDAFIEGLRFLADNKVWVTTKEHETAVKSYFMHLAKTDFSASTINIDDILFFYKSILSEHKSLFFDAVNPQEYPQFFATLKFGDRAVLIPKNLLIPQYPHFKNRLEHGWAEQGEINFEKEEINERFDVLASYFLTGEISINGENVLELLEYAHRNEIYDLQEGCVHFLGSFVSPNDRKNFEKVYELISLLGISEQFGEKLAQQLNEDNFISCMHFALEHQISSLIWQGLIFAKEHHSGVFFLSLMADEQKPEEKKKIEGLIKLAKECFLNNLGLSISSRNQTQISLNYSGKIEVKLLCVLKHIQSLVSVKELDVMEKCNMTDPFGYNKRGDRIRSWIESIGSVLPDIKEVKIDFIDLEKMQVEDVDKNISCLLKNFINIEGIGLLFPYDSESTNHYIDAFYKGSVESQKGKKVHLRALHTKRNKQGNLSEVLKKTPMLTNLSIREEVNPLSALFGLKQLEVLTLQSCSVDEECSVPHQVKQLFLIGGSITRIHAIHVKRLHVMSNFWNGSFLKEIHVQEAEHVYFNYQGHHIKELYFPFAKELFISKDTSDLEKITVETECKVIRERRNKNSGYCEQQEIPKNFLTAENNFRKSLYQIVRVSKKKEWEEEGSNDKI